MRKGQAEIFGLVIIVILLIFALLFFVKVRQDDDSNVVLRSSFRANNLMNAIINTEIDEDRNLREELKDCYSALHDPCGVQKTILRTIFDKTLLDFETYEFLAKKGNDQYITLYKEENVNDCSDGITASPVRLRGGYEFRLKLCS